MHFLVVDDSPENRLLLVRFLELKKASVDSAIHGQEALEKIARKTYDLVLMDIRMPVMDGFDAVTRLRSSGYKMPILAVTADARTETSSRCLSSGFTGYVSRPFHLETLLNEILSALSNSPKIVR